MRGKAHARRFEHAEKSAPSRELNPLEIGDTVTLQNQRGNQPNRWNATGTIVERLPHRQYQVMIDGSRRCTLRNRRFLRKSSIPPIIDDDEPVLPPPPQPIDPLDIPTPDIPEDCYVEQPSAPEITLTQDVSPAENNQPRRSTRIRRIPSHFKDFVMK